MFDCGGVGVWGMEYGRLYRFLVFLFNLELNIIFLRFFLRFFF